MKAMRKVLCLIAVLCLMAAVMAPAAFADDIGFPRRKPSPWLSPAKPAAAPTSRSAIMLRP